MQHDASLGSEELQPVRTRPMGTRWETVASGPGLDFLFSNMSSIEHSTAVSIKTFRFTFRCTVCGNSLMLI